MIKENDILTIILLWKNSGASKFLWKVQFGPLDIRIPSPIDFINSGISTYRCCLVPVEYMNTGPDHQNICFNFKNQSKIDKI